MDLKNMTQLYTVYKDLSSQQTDTESMNYKKNFNKLDLANIKNFSSEKVCAKRLKRFNHRQGENICKSHIWQRTFTQTIF